MEDVDLIRWVVESSAGGKAGGGIRSFKGAVAMINTGANRIGASRAVAIEKEALGAS